MEGQAIYITGSGEPVLIKDVNNPPAGVPPELTNFLKNIIKCDISFDKDKYDKAKKAADEKYDKAVKKAEEDVKKDPKYKALEKDIADKTADIAVQTSKINTLKAQYAHKNTDHTYTTELAGYNKAIGDDKHDIDIDEKAMKKMITDAQSKIQRDEVKIEFNCKSSDACAGASKCPLRNLSLHKGTQKVNGVYKDTTTIRNKKVDKDNLKEFNTDSIYFCPCKDADSDEDVYERVNGEFAKVG